MVAGIGVWRSVEDGGGGGDSSPFFHLNTPGVIQVRYQSTCSLSIMSTSISHAPAGCWAELLVRDIDLA